jgi:hypothetical protein
MEIAERLCVSPGTVRRHLENVFGNSVSTRAPPRRRSSGNGDCTLETLPPTLFRRASSHGWMRFRRS